jgi:hypothetical protein
MKTPRPFDRLTSISFQIIPLKEMPIKYNGQLTSSSSSSKNVMNEVVRTMVLIFYNTLHNLAKCKLINPRKAYKAFKETIRNLQLEFTVILMQLQMLVSLLIGSLKSDEFTW